MPNSISTRKPSGRIPQQDRSPASLYALAVGQHCAGQLFEAERGYRKILTIDPAHADSLHLLGVIGHQAGQHQAAEAMIRQAIGLNDKSSDYHCNLGSVLQALGRLEEAISSYQQAIALHASNSKAHNNLGNALLALGRTDEAIRHYAEALRLCPQDADAQNNLGNALQAAGQPLEAIACYEKAIALEGNHSQAHFNLGCALQKLGQIQQAADAYRQALALQPSNAVAHNNLGNVLKALNQPAEAIACYKQAILIAPGYAEPYHHLGNVLREQDKTEEALCCYIQALKAKPNYLEAAMQCGDALRELERFDEAAQLFEQVVKAAPDNAEVHRNYGEALRKLGNLPAAAEHCRTAIALLPTDADAQMNLALAQLKSGDLLAGWKNYEWRWNQKLAKGQKREFVQPLWMGEPIQGQRILLYGEQGLGDCLQFLRYLPLVQAVGGKIILELPHRLQRLAAQLPGIEESVSFGDALPAFDWQCPLVSLPLVFATDLDSIPATVPYLSAPPDACQKAQSYLWPTEGLRVGLAWAGNPGNQNDKFRSMPFACFQTLFGIPGVHFYALQLGEALKQLEASGAPVTDLAPVAGNMADTAAFLAELDLVITVDTSIAHLAGALGKPVWILLPSNADWRWLAEREDSPWYPTVRLFRQSELGHWESAIERVAAALRAFPQRAIQEGQ